MEQIFEQRKQARYGEMQQLYFSLYGEDPEAFSYLFQMLERCFQNRKPSLRQLDEARVKEAGWYRGNDLLGMLLYVA